MGKEEERKLESEIEIELQEQKESLAAINQALSSDPHNSDLISIQEELAASIKDAEEGLLHLKRARLLSELDLVVHGPVCSHKDDTVNHINSAERDKSILACEDVEADPADEVETLEESIFFVGSKCRFRHTDGRWYNGQIVELDGSTARLSFLNPTSEKMMICKFFLQQRCRYGANCRLSHGLSSASGILVPLSSLKKYVSPFWGESTIGATIWASSGKGAGIWREAELESWDNKLNQGLVVFHDNGSSETLGIEEMVLSQYAETTDDEERESDSSSSENSGSSDYEDNGLPQGLGFVESTALQKGIQTDTTIFADWESHTRGIASKMMASMGYRKGMGLGITGQGMVKPIPVKVLPPKQSLDHALQSVKNEERGESSEKKKKQSRGGKRKRERKFAEAVRAAKQEQEQRPDVFRLINTQLAGHAQMIGNDSSVKKLKRKETKQKRKETKKEDRRSLVAYEEEVKELRIRVEKLEDMVNRNRKEKAVYEAAMKKLTETRKALSEAEAKHASASDAVVSKEKEKKWLRF